MKFHYFLFLIIVPFSIKTTAAATLFNQLNTINACWSEQNDIKNLNIYTLSKPFSDKKLIQLHLQLVEKILRDRNTTELTKSQKEARIQNLHFLHQYLVNNSYPINNKVAWRNPVFIDDYNTFCAVGYLIKCSGNEALARKIASTNNLSYLRNMKNNDLNQWVKTCGLTLDELAWIQPGYVAKNYSCSLGKGVNGPVYALEGNDTTSTLYVAGSFTMADSSIACKNIIAVNYNKINIFSNTFIPLGDGINGEVKALYRDGTTLYAGGNFDSSGNTPVHNIAKWNGTIWEAMGELTGTVNCITKFNNQIFAGGSFTFTNDSQTFRNIAYWNGSHWEPICAYMNGEVNALKVYDDKLIVGGYFTHVDTTEVNRIFAYSNQQITKLGNGLPATVRAISIIANQLLAAGDFVNILTDSVFGYAYYNTFTGWDLIYKRSYIRFLNIDTSYIINAISAEYTAGKFVAGIMYNSSNTAVINDYPFSGNPVGLGAFASPNGEVSSIIKIGNRVFFGGVFNTLQTGAGGGGDWIYNASNLAVWDPNYVGLKNMEDYSFNFSISPNPSQSTTFIEAQSAIKSIHVFDLNGRLIWENKLSNYQKQYSIERSVFPNAGLYFVSIATQNGQTQNRKLQVD